MTLDARSLMARGGALDGVSALSAELLRGPRQRRAMEIGAEKQAEAERRQAVMDLLAESRGNRADELHQLQVEDLRRKRTGKKKITYTLDENGRRIGQTEEMVYDDENADPASPGAAPSAATPAPAAAAPVDPASTPLPTAVPVPAGSWIDGLPDVSAASLRRRVSDVASSPFWDLRRSGGTERTLGDYTGNPAQLSMDAVGAALDYLAKVHLVGTGATDVREAPPVNPAFSVGGPAISPAATTDQQAAIIGRIAALRPSEMRLPSGRRAIPQDEMNPSLMPAAEIPAGGSAPAEIAPPPVAAQVAAPAAAPRARRVVRVAEAMRLPINAGKSRDQIIADIQANGYTPVE